MERQDVPIIQHMGRTSDESGIIISWLIKVAVFLAVLGVVGFDAGSIIVNKVTLSTSAKDVAIAVSLTVSDAPSASNFSDTQIYDLAVDVVTSEEDGVDGAKVVRKGTEIDEDGIVHVRLRRKASTIVTKYIGPLKKHTVGMESGQAGTN